MTRTFLPWHVRSVRLPDRIGGFELGVVALLLGILLTALYGQTLSWPLGGDDFEWASFAHRALLEPHLILAPFGFFRPTATITLILDRLVWVTNPFGYRLSNLVFQLVAGVLLVAVGRRFGLSRVAAAAVGAVWVVSPYTSESVLTVAARHETHLLIFWLMIFLVWPLADQRWSAGRVALTAAALVGAVGSKEVWVATPALVAAVNFVGRGWRVGRSLAHAGWVAVLVGLYLLAQSRWFPPVAGYVRFDWNPLAKLSNALATFCQLEPLQAGSFRFSWAGVVAMCAVAGMVWVSVRWRQPAAALGAALLLASQAPTILVPFQPVRYLESPYAGFLLLVAGVLDAVARAAPVTRWRQVVTGSGLALALAVMLAGWILNLAEIADWQTIASAHSRLLSEAAEVVGEIETGLPVAVVRAETRLPLQELAEHTLGLDKPLYIRGGDAYGLTDTAALFDWVLDRDRQVVLNVSSWTTAVAGVPGRVLVHRAGEFRWLDGQVPDLAAEASQWVARGCPVRVIVVVSVPPI